MAVVAACGLPARGQSTDKVVRVGAGSYLTALPAGAREPPATIYKTAAVHGPMPTTGWWSSLAWLKHSERQYPHPLAVRAEPKGLRVHYPGPNIHADKSAIWGFMPEPSGADLVLGHSDQAEFPDARVDGFSDWFVRCAFAAGDKAMRVSYGHGSPFVYALFEGGSATVTFSQPPKVWAGAADTPVLGLTVNRRHYGLFGPTGSTWEGLGTRTFVNRSGGKPYFSLAVLPDDTEKTLALFSPYAYAHVTDTKVAWKYDQPTGAVATTFTFTTKPYEAGPPGTLFALYPHQWKHTAAKPLDLSYRSVRGPMRLAAGASFTTTMPFTGVLHTFPADTIPDKARLDGYLEKEAGNSPRGTRDVYWEGKRLGKVATLAAIAEQAASAAARERCLDELKGRLENWFTATRERGEPKTAAVLYHNAPWGALVAYPAAYGSDTTLNDHHFHYGYFIRAAAEVARSDPAWAARDRWGGIVNLLIRDVAGARRDDPDFPFLRCFDPYAGHSWASGNAVFGDGNNQESSSEAMNAWYGLILWGEAAGDRALRDLGIYLYTTELAAIEEYWFDVGGTNFPPEYPASVVTMVWGGKGANGTWFSAKPVMVHGINWLPITPGSLYLGRYPEYVKKNYDALVAETGGPRWDAWADLVWMYRALIDPADALRQFEAGEKTSAPEDGNSRANIYHWIHTLSAYGGVDRTVTADCPLYAVFRQGGRRTYVAYNMGAQPLAVRFSDGTQVTAPPKAFGIKRAG
jgi:endoglucanase Acf2